MDTNMTPPQGVFVPFFGVEACTASGLARVALKTDAAVLPGFLLWDEAKAKYVLRFGEEMELVRTGDAEADAVANTAAFTAAIEAVRAAVSGAVAVDAPAMEDAAAGRGGGLLMANVG